MKISGDFYPLTPQVSRKLRQGNLTASEWRIWSYLVEVDSWGDRYEEVDTLRIIEECSVSKATFYRAVAKLQELEIFDFQDIGFSIRNLHGVSSLKNETGVSEMRQQSQICETGLKNETGVSKVRQKSQICEKRKPEPLQNKDSDSPQIIQTYSDFIQTLSEEDCENFLNFVREKTKNLSQEVNDIEAWLANTNKAGKNRWEVYYEKYLDSKQTQVKKPATKNALDEHRRELELQQQQALYAWEQSKNQNTEE